MVKVMKHIKLCLTHTQHKIYQKSTQCYSNEILIVNVMTVSIYIVDQILWESVILGSPQQEVGRTEVWQPLSWANGQHQDQCRHNVSK